MSSYGDEADNVDMENPLVELESSKWREALTQVVGHFCPEHGFDSELELVEKGPYWLEKSTFERLDSTVSPQFLLITAPSGVGKGTVGRILETYGVKRIPRVNTRGRRPGEREDEYHFVPQEEYDQMLARGELWCPTESKAGGNCAGIEKESFLDAIEARQPFYIDSGAGTAAEIRQEPEMSKFAFLVVFILPPTFEEMVRRLEKRMAEENQLLQAGVKGQMMDKATMAKRLDVAVDHLSHAPETTDLFVVNDDPERAAKRILELFPGLVNI